MAGPADWTRFHDTLSAGISAESREIGAIIKNGLRGLCCTLHVSRRISRVDIGCVRTTCTVIVVGDGAEAVIHSRLRSVAV